MARAFAVPTFVCAACDQVMDMVKGQGMVRLVCRCDACPEQGRQFRAPLYEHELEEARSAVTLQ